MMTEESIPTSGGLPRRTRLFTVRDLWSGAAAGIIAGLAMGLFALVIGAIYADLWAPVKSLAGVVYPPTVTSQPGFDAGPVLAGTVIHLIVATVLGMVFAVLYRAVMQFPFQLGVPYLMGAIYGLAIWAITFIVLPQVNPVMAAADKPAFLLAHVLYGVVLGLAYQYLHSKQPRQQPPSADSTDDPATAAGNSAGMPAARR